MRKKDWKGDDLNFPRILVELVPSPTQSSQSQTELCVTPFVLLHNFCHLKINGYGAGVGKLVKSIVTMVNGDNF